MAENREHQLVEGDAVMRVSGGGHFKQKSIKSKFVSISLRDKLIFLFVGTLFVELLLFGCVMSFYLYINAKKNVSDNIDTTVIGGFRGNGSIFFGDGKFGVRVGCE